VISQDLRVRLDCDAAANSREASIGESKPGQPEVSVVFSFRNEERNLAELIARTQRALETVTGRYELIFVNDASTDASLELLTRENARDPRIKVLNMARRFGVGEGVLAGFRASSGAAVVYLDADLQDPPEIIPGLVEKWRAGFDVVHTVRSARRGESQWKLFLTRCAYRLINFGATIELRENAGDFKLLSRRALDHLLALPEHDPYLRGLAVWVGFPQAYVPYERDARHAGASHFPLFSRNPAKTFVSGLTSFSFMPLYAFAWLGIVLLAAGAIAVAAGLLTDRDWSRWSFIVGVVVLLNGLVVTQVNMVAIYILRIYKDVRGRPRYIVASTIGFESGLEVADRRGSGHRVPN
jgi:dolichol-phosphate mannosyltransferase